MFRSSLLAFLLVLAGAAARAADAVGFAEEHANGTEIGIWYPAAGRTTHERIGLATQDVVDDAAPVGTRLPLVVISHGSGGSYASHVDTAAALAAHGFVVAALTHPGDNYRDQSAVTAVENRPAALKALVDWMLGSWRWRDRLDPARIGAFGFSAGGFTALVAAGGQPDLALIGPHCRAQPALFDCRILAAHPRPLAGPPFVHDRRIRAIVVAAPALGFAFGRAGLRDVRVPVQLWRADDDRILPAPDYADAVRAALPRPPEFHGVPGADHGDFLAPCARWAAAVPLCASAPGFDRTAFHRMFDAAVVGFFERTLGGG